MSEADFDAILPTFPGASGPAADDARREALRFLIGRVWLQKEAERRGVDVSEQMVADAISEIQDVAPSPQAVSQALSRRNMTREQLRERVEVDALGHELARAIFRPRLDISDREIRAYFLEHRFEFDVPATRQIRAVISQSAAPVRRARIELENGASWPAVVRRFSTDPSKKQGGRLIIASDNVLPDLRETVLEARVGELTGPVHLAGAWWLFEVERSASAQEPSLRVAAPRVRTILVSSRESVALDRLSVFLRKRYRPLTVCAPGFRAPQCRNFDQALSG